MMKRSLMMLPLGLLLAGCAQVPKPMTYELTYQQKMQAAHHWNDLAETVANRVLNQQAAMGTASVYVEPVAGVFGEAFTKLLESKLVGMGLPVAPMPTGAAVLATDVNLIRHRAKWPHRANRTNPGTWTAVATVVRLADSITKNMIIPAGIAADLLDGSTTTLTKHEVVITTSLEKDGQYLMRHSDLYYVNDADRAQYAACAPGMPKTMEVVTK